MAEEEVHPIGQTRRDVSRVAAGEASDENAITLGVMLEINSPALLPDLVKWLEAGGCAIRVIDDRVCHVVHTEAADAAEEWYELRFFLRAWQASMGVEVTLRLKETPAGEAASG